MSDAADGGGQHGAARPLPDGWTDWDVGRLEAELQRHNRLYWERNAPEITDYDYDRLVEALRAKAPDSPILEALGEPVPEIGSQVRHAEPMLSLDKCYSEEDLLKWAEKFEGEVVMTPKIDGVACSIRYGADGRLAHAATRGSGVVGEDITQNVLRIRNVPPALEAGITRGREVEVRGEVYLPLSVFAKLEGEFANPRNTAAGAIKHKDAGRSAAMGLRFFAYNVMGLDEQAETMHGRYALAAQLGFEPVEFDRLDKDAMQAGYDAYVARRESLDYEIDGVVFIADDIAEHVRMGATAHHPRYAIAYKLQGESATTVLREVEWSVSRSRALTPVGIVDPVKLSGATVTRISLHNWGLVQSKNLSIGARVVAMRRGGVIPYLEAVVEPGDGEIRPPETCPSCESPTLIEGDFVYCGNESGCRATAIETLKFFARAIDIEGFGAVWLETLFDAGLLRHPQDFFRLRALDLLEFERMGRTLANKLVDNIAAHREVPLATFMTALGVPGLGKTVAGSLARHFRTLEAVRAAAVEDIVPLSGFAEKLATQIVEGLAARTDLVDALLVEMTVRPDETPAPEADDRPRPWDGQSFLFTATLGAMKRGDAQARVLALGGTTPGSVSKKLSYLVVGSEGQAGSKLQKAEKAGVTVLDEAAFIEMLEAAEAEVEAGAVPSGPVPIDSDSEPDSAAQSTPSAETAPTANAEAAVSESSVDTSEAVGQLGLGLE